MMKVLRILLPLGVVLLTQLAHARSWQEVQPDVTTLEELKRRFGPPSREMKRTGESIVAYFGGRAIHGTKQVQFHIDEKRNVVSRINVFPNGDISVPSIEKTYGPVCSPDAVAAQEPCFVRKQTPQGQQFLLFPAMGFSVFLRKDGIVQSLVFVPEKR